VTEIKTTTPLKTRIARARELAGLSTGQAVRPLGVDRAWLARVEAEQEPPTEAFLRDLAQLCRTSVAWLLGDAPQIPESTQELLRKSKLTPRDREELLEVAGMWSTPEEGGARRGGRP